MDHILQGLVPNAQVILVICLLVLVTGFSLLLILAAFSRFATENICCLLSTIAGLLKPSRVIQVHLYSSSKLIASSDTERLCLADESE